jgi:hypothetical protein
MNFWLYIYKYQISPKHRTFRLIVLGGSPTIARAPKILLTRMKKKNPDVFFSVIPKESEGTQISIGVVCQGTLNREKKQKGVADRTPTDQK